MIVSHLFGSALAAYKRWQAYQDTVRQLEALDDRELDDLGINRGDIERVARTAVSH
jgi:uncharacterized protein YjiS (DUF1127 family)